MASPPPGVPRSPRRYDLAMSSAWRCFALIVTRRDVHWLLVLVRSYEPLTYLALFLMGNDGFDFGVPGSTIGCAEDHCKDRKKDHRENECQYEDDFVTPQVDEADFHDC